MGLQARLGFLLRACAVLAALGTTGIAQEYRSRLLGHVADPSGAVVPKASIAVVNTATSVTTSSRTNDEGNFLVILEPGTYTMTVEAAGFKKKLVSNIAVRSGDQSVLDISLELGSSAEAITVTGEVPQLETASASISQVVDRRFLDLLYVSNRNPLNLVSLTPGVYTGTYGPNAVDAQQNQFSMNGGAGIEYIASTDAPRACRLSLSAPGLYSITVSKAGFKTEVRSRFAVRLNQRVEIGGIFQRRRHQSSLLSRRFATGKRECAGSSEKPRCLSAQISEHRDNLRDRQC